MNTNPSYILDENIDKKRQISVIKFLSGISLFLCLLALLFAIGDVIEKGVNYRGISPIILCLPVIYFVFLILLTRTRYYFFSSYGIILFYFLVATYTVSTWGFILPTGLLIYGLTAVMCGIMINSLASLILSVLIFGTMLVISYLQDSRIIKPDLSWITNISIGTDDILVYIFVLAVITAVAWLSNREIDKSLKRARASELALKQERDLLEVKVEERTRELREAQMEQMAQLYRFAELGQLSAGILHDIANPLTTVSLNLEQLEIQRRSQLVRRARQGIKQMQDFIMSARRKLQSESVRKEFSAVQEIRTALTMLQYRLRREHISVSVVEKMKLKLIGNDVKFQQVITNLVSNAIDAYSDVVDSERVITITISQFKKQGHIEITDLGKGMTQAEQKKAFDAFFSTKSTDSGMGLGLAICQDIMHKEFHGTIKLVSHHGRGTAVTLIFPLS